MCLVIYLGEMGTYEELNKLERTTKKHLVFHFRLPSTVCFSWVKCNRCVVDWYSKRLSLFLD